MFGIHGGSHPWFPLPVITPALIVVTLVYLRGWYRLPIAIRGVLSPWRLVAFISGVFALWAVVASPLAELDHHLLTIHMVQHLLLMTVAAPLILLGAPLIALLNSFPPHAVNRLLRPLLWWAPVQRLGRMVAHPAFCWLASTAIVIGWHLPALFDLGLRSERWHRVQHASFFAAGLLFWWPVVQPWPGVARWPRWTVPLYLFLATLPCDVLSGFLAFCDRVVYQHYLSSHRALSISSLADQERAGALMWVCVTLVYLVPAVVVTIQILSPEGRSQGLRFGSATLLLREIDQDHFRIFPHAVEHDLRHGPVLESRGRLFRNS
jgi:putative membrane protein